MVETNRTDLPGTEVPIHDKLHEGTDGQRFWGVADTSSKYYGTTEVDGARKFTFGSDERKRFIEMGGVVIGPPDLELGEQQSWMTWGVKYPHEAEAE